MPQKKITNCLKDICSFTEISETIKTSAFSSFMNYTTRDLFLVSDLCYLFEHIAGIEISKKLSQQIALFSIAIPIDLFVDAATSLLSNPNWNEHEASLLSIMRIFFFVSEYYCQSYEPRHLCFSTFTKKDIPYFATKISSIFVGNIKKMDAYYFALYGSIRAFQIRQNAKLPSSKGVLDEWEKLFMGKIENIKPHHLSYLMGEFTLNRSQFTIENLEQYQLITIYESCFTSIIEHEAFLCFPQLSLLEKFNAENEKLLVDCLDRKMAGPEELFSSLGKISKMLANGIKLLLDTANFDKIKGFFKRYALKVFSNYRLD
jgi:hypothetical protein